MRLAAVVVVMVLALGVPTGSRAPLDTLPALSALPAHLITRLQEPGTVVRTRSGTHLVLDPRAHTVYAIDPNGQDMRRLLEVGHEPGHVLQPSALAISGDDIFAVLDRPNNLQRIQYFDTSGLLIGGFFLPISGTPRMVVGDRVIAGASALTFTGRTFLVNEPAWGSLLAELDTTGRVVRHVGQLRRASNEADPELRWALNAGVPLDDPKGGFVFVFQTGVPAFRKYDASGRLVFERHIEGPELDELVQSLPTTWPRSGGTTRPIVPALVRTAALDERGQLWVSLQTPFTYVYDATGEKIRVVQFRAAGPSLPTSFFFPRPGRVLTGPEGYEFATD